MAVHNLAENDSVRKRAERDFADAIEAFVESNYDRLCDEREYTHEKLSASIHNEARSFGLNPEFVATLALNGIAKLVSPMHNGGGQRGRLPSVAAAIVSSAIGVLSQPLNRHQTIQAYRNRHQEFISAMAEFAAAVTQDDLIHRSFYEHLGRLVSTAVLDHDLATSGEGISGPESNWSYRQIETAALEQMVYFIQAGADGPIKIGIASDPKARLSTLQTGHYQKLEIAALTSGGREQEARYHAAFAAHRLEGEWFARHPDILTEIDILNTQEMGRGLR